MRSFESAEILFVEKGRETVAAEAGDKNLLAFSPQSRPSLYSAPCEPSAFEARLSKAMSAAEKTKEISSYFEKCEKELHFGNSSGWGNLVYTMGLDFDWTTNSFMNPVHVRLPGGSVLRGLIALRGDARPRPMVVVRSGVFAGIDEMGSEKYFLMQLFEQGHANVLILENDTASGYVRRNPGYQPGGVFEGAQNVFIAGLLRDPAQPLSKITSSVHFLGISLGGHGLFHAAALEARHGTRNIDSFLALCPVVDLHSELNRWILPTFRGTLIDTFISSQLAPIREQLRSMPEDSSAPPEIRQRLFKKALQLAEQTFQTRREFMAGLVTPAAQETDFWRASNVWPWFRNVTTPVTVVVAEPDVLVPATANGDRIANLVAGTSSNISVAKLKHGFHCSFPATYRWDAVAALLQGALLPPVNAETTEETERIVLDDAFDDPVTIHFDGHVTSKGLMLRVPVRLETKYTIRRNLVFEVDARRFDFTFHNSHLTAADRKMLARWMHKNVTFRYEAGKTYAEAVWAATR